MLEATKSEEDAETLNAWKERFTGPALRIEKGRLLMTTPYNEMILHQVKEACGWKNWDGDQKTWNLAAQHEDLFRELIIHEWGTDYDLATKIGEDARNRGTGLHARVEAHFGGLPQPTDSMAQAAEAYWESVAPVLKSIRTVKLIEGTVWNEEAGYAGAVDCIAEIIWPATGQWVTAVLDWKTSDRVKKLEHVIDYTLQVSAYATAANMVYRADGLNIQHGVVVVAIPDHEAQLFYLDPGEMADAYLKFEERVRVFHNMRAA